MRKLVLSALAACGLVVTFRMLERRGIAPAHGTLLGVPYDVRLTTAAAGRA